MLENVAYCPTLYTRVSEMKALFQLPAATKDRLLPLLIARPWPNANELVRTWEKIGEALGTRRFALDLDQSRSESDSSKPAAAQFNALFDPDTGFANYYATISDIPGAIPVLRISNGAPVEFEQQAENIEALDRGVIVRLEHGAIINPLELVDLALDRLEDAVIVVDAGWSNDLLGRELWASQIVERVSDIRPATELVVTGSSFPNSFVNIQARGLIPVRERFLHSNLVRRHNAANIVYGDWGSTRPPSDPVPMKNVPRIDLPTTAEWISFRQDKDDAPDEDYSDIAARVLADESWPADLDIWGTYTIECTAEGLPGAIRSPAVAAAARINIHMHRQAFFGDAGPISDGEEPFVD